jgi:hypothetical protein
MNFSVEIKGNNFSLSSVLRNRLHREVGISRHVSIHANYASENRNERYKSPRTIYVLGVKNLIGIKIFVGS